MVSRIGLDGEPALEQLGGGTIAFGRADRCWTRTTFDLEKIRDRILRIPRRQEAPAGARGAGRGGPGSVQAVAPVPAGRACDRRQSSAEPILCFVGPPGVGKTSLGQSIARALGRRFVAHVSGRGAGRSRDSGHRRTYIVRSPAHHSGPPASETRDPVSCSTRSTRSERTGGVIHPPLTGGAGSRPEPHLRGQLPWGVLRPVAVLFIAKATPSTRSRALRDRWRSWSCPGTR